MLKQGRPYYLPQISAPYTIILDKLAEEGISYDITEINPSEDDDVELSQSLVFSNELKNLLQMT